MLTTDLHLARLAPELFIDAADLATTLVEGSDGSISGTTFTAAAADFESAEIDFGHIIIVNGAVLEIDSRADATDLEVSRPRADDADAIIAPTSGSDLVFAVRTFARLIGRAESWVLGALGIDEVDPKHPVHESSVINLDELINLIALRAIATTYDLASARAPDDAALSLQAAHWRVAERRERARSVVFLDLDGDGVPDATRRIDVAILRRS